MTLTLRFRIWAFTTGRFEITKCPNCGRWTHHAPGNWPRKSQRRINLNHWKDCEQ